MIYLLRSYGISGRSNPILKIGFTDNIQNRWNQYFYQNPRCEFVSTREGDEVLESLLHYYLRSLGLQYKKNGKLSEWFIEDSRIYQIFHISRDSLERKIWKHREGIFDYSKLSSKGSCLEYNLFEYLWKKNKESFEGERIVVNSFGKPIRTKAKEVDLSFWESWCKKNPDKIFENISLDFSEYYDEYERVTQDFLDNHFYKTGFFHEKMRIYCEFMDSYKGNKEIEDIIYYKIRDERFRKYYNFYGTKGCSAKKYVEKLLVEGMLESTKDEKLEKAIYNYFKPSQRYTKKEIKSGLEVIYRDLGITSRKPKATDLEKYFRLSRTRITNPQTGKLDEGYRLDSL